MQTSQECPKLQDSGGLYSLVQAYDRVDGGEPDRALATESEEFFD